MCDYSLMAVPNRLAREGEALVVHRFPTGSLGLASPESVRRKAAADRPRRSGWLATVFEFFSPPAVEAVCAVCVPPGARLPLYDIPPRLQLEGNAGACAEVTFTQLTAAAHMYRDAVRFANGREVRLQELKEGQRVRVLDLSGAGEPDLTALYEENRRMLLQR